MFYLSYISGGLEIWSVNDTSKNGNSELKVFLNEIFFGGISSNWLLTILQCINTPSVISK